MMRFLIMVTICFLAGCATITGNRNFDARYDQIQKGISTRQEVLNLLGSPTQVAHPDQLQTVLIYEKRKIYTEFGFPCKQKVDTTRLSVFINEKDVVTDYKVDTMSDDYLPQSGGGGTTYNSYQPSQPAYTPPPAYRY